MTSADGPGAEERAELARLRAEISALRADVRTGHQGRWGRRGRWLGACALLLLAAVLGGVSLLAGYVRGQVLDTDTYVETVTPVLAEPAVQDAVARRLTDEIMRRADVAGLARTVADRLVDEGVPPAVTTLVDPVVAGLNSFLYDRIRPLLATEQAQAVWQQVNTLAHQAVVTVLTGREGTYLTSAGDSVTLNLGAVLSFVKQKLVEQGLTFVARIPDVSIPFTVVQSDALPDLRTYTRVLDVAATWLPWVVLALALGGVLAAPNRRRGIITGAVMLGVVAALLLFAIAVARAYYQDNLPADVSEPAALAVFDAFLRFLVAALQAVLVALGLIVVIGLLWGPSPPAVFARRWADRGLDALGAQLARTGRWAVAAGRAIGPARRVIYVLVCLLAVVGYVAVARPSMATVWWLLAGVALVALVVEVFARAATVPPPVRKAEPGVVAG
ncbi:hypothetical protein [Luedemannella helvata]|uniref:Integral membrane protein n=1 Tax=Luedemannella helvata TaxID=349315 RepID=A0ABN2JNX6_9ACTN